MRRSIILLLIILSIAAYEISEDFYSHSIRNCSGQESEIYTFSAFNQGVLKEVTATEAGEHSVITFRNGTEFSFNKTHCIRKQKENFGWTRPFFWIKFAFPHGECFNEIGVKGLTLDLHNLSACILPMGNRSIPLSTSTGCLTEFYTFIPEDPSPLHFDLPKICF